MQIKHISSMHKGWLIGDFTPSMIRTEQFEFAIQQYKAGDVEFYHYHKIASELTVIIQGTAEMNGQRFQEGDAILLEPGEGTDFKAISNVITAVIKIPSVKNDKFE